MPLYKRKSFPLVEKPQDIKPQELVFQIRFTKEIFRSYNEYLKRINFYRQKVWTCKATGKGSLTYEEALASEDKASKRIQNIPIEYVAPVLRDIQYSMLNLKDLVNAIAAKLQGPFSEGAEIYGMKDGSLHLCRIIKVIDDTEQKQYKIAWLGTDHKISGKALVNADDLTGKNLPFSKRFLKSFVKDSTYRSMPWVLNENLAKKHGISTAPPEVLKSKVSMQNGLVVCNRKRKKSEEIQSATDSCEKDIKVYRRRNSVSPDGVNDNSDAQSMKYPIDDLLVQPSEEDRLLLARPSPCREFTVPMDCVGDLLMVWDFCASFGRLLNLSPFSLEDFENSVCCKDSTPLLIVESCSSILRLLIKDNGEFSMAIQNKKRKPKITQLTWAEYLCDFMETSCTLEICRNISTIKRGHYCLLEIHVKLTILRELVARALETDIVKEKLDEYIEERQALAATRRDEALDKGRKRREEKERKKLIANGKDVKEGLSVPNGGDLEKGNGKVRSGKNRSSRNSEVEQGDSTSKKNAKKQKIESNATSVDANHASNKRVIHKLMKNEIKESLEMKSAEERTEFIEQEIEKRVIRTSPLGKDRNYCRYWFFQLDGRIFVENSESTQWGYYQTKDEVDALIGSLNPKGERERALKKHLQKFYTKICSGLEQKSKEAVEQSIEMEEALVRRSTRVRAPPRENPALAFLKYVNKWKEL